jgi:hypothetical protein
MPYIYSSRGSLHGPKNMEQTYSDGVNLLMYSSQIHSPLLGAKADYGIGLSYRPASLCSLTGRYDNPMP